MHVCMSGDNNEYKSREFFYSDFLATDISLTVASWSWNYMRSIQR